MPEFWNKTKKWASGLPWYWKWGGYILLALAFFGVLAVLVFGSGSKKEEASNLKELDNVHADEVKTTLDILEDEQKELQAEIKKKKVEIATKLNQAKKIDEETMRDRDKIEKAETMAELLELQEKLGL